MNKILKKIYLAMLDNSYWKGIYMGRIQYSEIMIKHLRRGKD